MPKLTGLSDPRGGDAEEWTIAVNVGHLDVARELIDGETGE
jgi:hypothetical protein